MNLSEQCDVKLLIDYCKILQSLKELKDNIKYCPILSKLTTAIY